MPLPISLAHRIARRLAAVRKTGELSYLRPDGKTQVSVIYEDGRPVGIDTILVSTQHDATIGDITDNDLVQQKIKSDLWKAVVEPVFSDLEIKPDANTRYLVNPTGKFVIGRRQGDSRINGTENYRRYLRWLFSSRWRCFLW
jgi:S-adenosylmethionine synthetase